MPINNYRKPRRETTMYHLRGGRVRSDSNSSIFYIIKIQISLRTERMCARPFFPFSSSPAKHNQFIRFRRTTQTQSFNASSGTHDGLKLCFFFIKLFFVTGFFVPFISDINKSQFTPPPPLLGDIVIKL